MRRARAGSRLPAGLAVEHAGAPAFARRGAALWFGFGPLLVQHLACELLGFVGGAAAAAFEYSFRYRFGLFVGGHADSLPSRPYAHHSPHLHGCVPAVGGSGRRGWLPLLHRGGSPFGRRMQEFRCSDGCLCAVEYVRSRQVAPCRRVTRPYPVVRGWWARAGTAALWCLGERCAGADRSCTRVGLLRPPPSAVRPGRLVRHPTGASGRNRSSELSVRCSGLEVAAIVSL